MFNEFIALLLVLLELLLELFDGVQVLVDVVLLLELYLLVLQIVIVERLDLALQLLLRLFVEHAVFHEVADLFGGLLELQLEGLYLLLLLLELLRPLVRITLGLFL